MNNSPTLISISTIYLLVVFAQTAIQVAQSNKDVHLGSFHNDCKATSLEDQVVNGKWKNYDIVLDNCLVWHFIESSKEDINFYALLEEQESLISQMLNYHRDSIQHLVKASEKGNKIKSELALKASRRRSKRFISKLNKINEESQMKATLMEVEVRELMDRCNLSARGSNTECAKMKEQTLNRVKQACDRMRGQNAILMAMMLDRQVNFN